MKRFCYCENVISIAIVLKKFKAVVLALKVKKNLNI